MTGIVHGSTFRLDGILSRAAVSDPHRVAVIFGSVSWTYAEVNDCARQLASSLTALGVQIGDRVALWAFNRAEFIEVLFGIPLLGAIAVPLDHWWTKNDAMAALAQVQPKVLIVGSAQAAHLEGQTVELESAGVKHVLSLDEPPYSTFLPYARRLADAAPLREALPVSIDDPALILFTSGSTGRSKGAVHTHRGLCATAMIMSLELGLLEGERTLHFLPLFSSCLEHLIPLTFMRGTHVIMPQFDAAEAWQVISSQRITHIDTVPTTLRRMLEHLPASIPKSLRLIAYASEPMPAQLVKTLRTMTPLENDLINWFCLTIGLLTGVIVGL